MTDQQHLNELSQAREKIARMLNFNVAPSASNPTAYFVEIHYAWATQYQKIHGCWPPDDEFTKAHTRHYQTLRYAQGKFKNKQTGKTNKASNGKKYYQAQVKLGQADLFSGDDVLAVTNLADDLADLLRHPDDLVDEVYYDDNEGVI